MSPPFRFWILVAALLVLQVFSSASRPVGSPLALTLGTGTKPLADIEEMVVKWLQVGGRSIDTALLYTGAQAAIASALQRLEPQNITRSDVFITSKVPGVLSYNGTIAATRKCLRQLETSYIDLMLIHWPCPTSTPSTNCTTTPTLTRQRLQTWRALEDLQRRGLLRHIGVSNYNKEQVQELFASPDVSTTPLVNQVEWHLGHHDDDMALFLRAHNSTLQAYSALSGFAYPAVSLSDPTVLAIAAQHNVTSAQVALRWSIQKLVFVIYSTTKTEYMNEDMGIFDFQLSSDEMRRLGALKPT